MKRAGELGLALDGPPSTPYRNTIPPEKEPPFPGDLKLEERIVAIMRWNALAMVMRANHVSGELGGHIASYASAAEIFEVGFNHFFRARSDEGGGDIVYFQPHSAPGVYARAFLEGRLTEENLDRYRREIGGAGLSSYPHPWLMPDFWQTPTGSMGIGPISAIYQARFMRYLADRGLVDTRGRRVWGVFGDGEMDEPESDRRPLARGARRARQSDLRHQLQPAAARRTGAQQRTDHRGAGAALPRRRLAGDQSVVGFGLGSAVRARYAPCPAAPVRRDGRRQVPDARRQGRRSTIVAHFFKEDPEALALVAQMSPHEIDGLRRGGHDFRKLYAAFDAARATAGRPTVILAKTKKGYGMGGAGQSRMTAHQAKKLDKAALHEFRDALGLPLGDAEVERLEFYRPDENSPELAYLRERRNALGGYLPRAQAERGAGRRSKARNYAQFAA